MQLPVTWSRAFHALILNLPYLQTIYIYHTILKWSYLQNDIFLVTTLSFDNTRLSFGEEVTNNLKKSSLI